MFSILRTADRASFVYVLKLYHKYRSFHVLVSQAYSSSQILTKYISSCIPSMSTCGQKFKKKTKMKMVGFSGRRNFYVYFVSFDPALQIHLKLSRTSQNCSQFKTVTWPFWIPELPFNKTVNQQAVSSKHYYLTITQKAFACCIKTFFFQERKLFLVLFISQIWVLIYFTSSQNFNRACLVFFGILPLNVSFLQSFTKQSSQKPCFNRGLGFYNTNKPDVSSETKDK